MQPRESIGAEGPAGPSLHAVLNAAPHPLYALDSSGRLFFANASWERFLSGEIEPHRGRRGRSGEHPTGPFLDLVPTASRAHWQAIIDGLLASKAYNGPGGAYVEEVAAQSAEGREPVRIVATAIREESGVPAGVLLTSVRLCADPTAAELERQRQLEEAAGLDVARQLAATLNHEINNPLFIVSATLEDLLADTSDPLVQRRLNAALEAVWRVASAVKQLQDIRRLVSTSYIEGRPMIDLEASQEHPESDREKAG